MRLSSFGHNLRKYRKAKGWNQKALGEQIGVGQVAVANYERGIRFPGEKTLLLLCDILNISLDELMGRTSVATPPQEKPFQREDSRQSYIDLVMAGKIEDSIFYLKNLRHEGLSLLTIFEDVLLPALKQVGEGWMRGEVQVAEEHFFSQCVRQAISVLSYAEQAESEKNRTWVAVCVPGEVHDMALLMFSELLRLRGWRTWFMGLNLPSETLLWCIKQRKADALGISVTIPEHVNTLEVYLRSVRESSVGNRLPIILGGMGTNFLKKQQLDDLGIDQVAHTLQSGLEWVRSLE